MGLKGYRLWVMGQLDSTCRAPPRENRRAQQRLTPAADSSHRGKQPDQLARGVALQVAFEKQTLKPIFYLVGYRLWV
jgi:hypothetical protein